VGITYQRDVRGGDTGTDGMAAVLGGVDAAATSVGVCVRNMHTVSELGHTGDVLASVHALHAALGELANEKKGEGGGAWWGATRAGAGGGAGGGERGDMTWLPRLDLAAQ